MSDDPLADLIRDDPRYPRSAYIFVREALHHTVEKLGEQRHVTARELLEGIRDYARDEFGPLAATVFASWNVRTTSDFGAIVFNLVAVDEMGRTDDDQLSDFDNGYRFEDAFPTDTGAVEVHRADEDDAI